MKTGLALIPAAVTAILLTLAPASAQWRNSTTDYYDDTSSANGYGTQRGFRHRNGWNQGPRAGSNGGWNSRNVSGSDPSFGNRSGINAARRTGRCVADLGYGRYEYCGW